MQVINRSFHVDTGEAPDIVDITQRIQGILSEARIQNGTVLVFTPHTTVAIKINEKEEGLIADLKRLMTSIVPSACEYRHDDLETRDPATMCDGEECLNGHAHLQQMLFGSTSETIPIIHGKLSLGRWQHIFLIELSDPRERTVTVTITGN
ncbi:secondary thiamine-phosphate synthase enzyme YjbQ [Patescibacteria group bacterium]|nr:secondary thiamine-phosphate synthase enzyme YjbQ [Patescibacteria group bacterium]MBU1074876.1 secondary thiamine-phosphate synthase enzyme YjbQ [Patescibacteria group bacterium]MBU1951532.1 secondary thiamine-phosphate synthase enzyme YjbQ [Patescibacteria group bacterium]